MSFLRDFTDACVRSARNNALGRGVSPRLVTRGVTSLYPLNDGRFAFLACGNHEKILAIASMEEWEKVADEKYPSDCFPKPSQEENEVALAELIRAGYLCPNPGDGTHWSAIRPVLVKYFQPDEMIEYKVPKSWDSHEITSVENLLKDFPGN